MANWVCLVHQEVFLSKQRLWSHQQVLPRRCFCQNKYRTIVAGRKIDAQRMEAYSLRWFSVPPGSQASPFFVLRFAFSIIHGSGRVWKTGEGHGNSYHVNDVRWTRDGHRGGRGRTRIHENNVLDFIIEHSTARQDPRCSQDHKYSAWPVRNSLSGLLRPYL